MIKQKYNYQEITINSVKFFIDSFDNLEFNIISENDDIKFSIAIHNKLSEREFDRLIYSEIKKRAV